MERSWVRISSKTRWKCFKKAIPGFIPIPNPGLDSTCKGRKMQVTKWGTPKKTKKHVLSEPYTILGSIFNVK
jgi:hypothetical protein